MGGSGGGVFRNQKPSELRDRVRDVEAKTRTAVFDTELSQTLGALLGKYNGRDSELARERLEHIKTALRGTIEGTIDQMFGGSVAKHTYVDGLSDIDSLVVINDTALQQESPQTALMQIEDAIRRRLKDDARVERGRMAITVEYGDGMAIQLLPAIKQEDGRLHVPSSRRDAWSEIDPTGFREALTRRNEACGGKLVPTIKLAKAINGTLPEAQQLSGYHMESLAIAAFRDYSGEKTTTSMLPVFFERARELVLSPIRDSTGQSVHVDAYLGPTNSEARVTASHVMGRLAKRMRNASAAGSVPQWRALFGLDE
jgi:hypothetical protein